ncbi:MAG: hypothetical protein HYY49_08840, partial [Ignavibacteriales bacterium]|nr:hypothetical protein [Ignavibacteriales bacterium]
MKKAMLAILSIIVFTSLVSAQQFEGIIELQMKGPNMDTPTPMKYMVKGDLVRTESQ